MRCGCPHNACSRERSIILSQKACLLPPAIDVFLPGEVWYVPRRAEPWRFVFGNQYNCCEQSAAGGRLRIRRFAAVGCLAAKPSARADDLPTRFLASFDFPPLSSLPPSQPSNWTLIRRLLGLAWRHRLGCLHVLAEQAVLVVLALMQLGSRVWESTSFGISSIPPANCPIGRWVGRRRIGRRSVW